MAIYQLFEEKKEYFTETFEHVEEQKGQSKEKSHFFSSLVTRFCFFLLLIGDLLWFLYSIVLFVFSGFFFLLSGGKTKIFKRIFTKSALNLRRSATCGLALFVGLFSPPFGIMIACTYFLMYDKAGMEEVVPAPLQAQMKDLFHTEQ